MKIIVGLGNPGMDYVKTRHNVGFEVLNLFAKKNNFKFSRKNNYMISENNFHGEKLLLVKPLTYMNLSGDAIASVFATYKCQVEDLLVIYDDMDLPCGKVRCRAKGSAGGHNGIKSIIKCIHTQDFNRIRVGIGKEENAIDFVLGKFSKVENKLMAEAYETVCDAIEDWMNESIDYVMNKYN